MRAEVRGCTAWCEHWTAEGEYCQTWIEDVDVDGPLDGVVVPGAVSAEWEDELTHGDGCMVDTSRSALNMDRPVHGRALDLLPLPTIYLSMNRRDLLAPRGHGLLLLISDSAHDLPPQSTDKQIEDETQLRSPLGDPE